MLAKPNYNGALFSHIRDGGVDFMWKNLSVNITGIVNFVRENIGIFQSVSTTDKSTCVFTCINIALYHEALRGFFGESVTNPKHM